MVSVWYDGNSVAMTVAESFTTLPHAQQDDKSLTA